MQHATMSPADGASDNAQCINLPYCRKARTSAILAWYPGAGEFCPECGEALARLYRLRPTIASVKAQTPAYSRPAGHKPIRARRKILVKAAVRLPASSRREIAIVETNQPASVVFKESSVSSAPPVVTQRPVATQQPAVVEHETPAVADVAPTRAAAPTLVRVPDAGPQLAVVTLVIVAVVVILSIVAIVALRPHISGIAIPRVAPAEAPITVAYRSSGLGNADYTILTSTGATLQHGELAMGAGTFTVTLPRATSTRTYQVRLHAGNALLDAESDALIRVPGEPLAVRVRRAGPTRASAGGASSSVEPPEIRSLALDRATVAAGDTVSVYYDVAASSGSISLFDPATLITYAREDLSDSGHTSFTIPRVDGPRVLTVILTAQRAAVTAQSRVGVNVVPVASPALPNGGDVARSSRPTVAAALSAPRSVKARAPIHVEVRGASSQLRVVMLDTSGAEFARRDVPAGARGATFTAPNVRTPTRFTFEATFTEGQGSETVVREIAVTP
jgi:hypothetical protein